PLRHRSAPGPPGSRRPASPPSSSTSEKVVQTRPSPLPTLLVRAAFRVARCAHSCEPGRRRRDPAAGTSQRATTRWTSRHVTRSRACCEVCETGSVSSAPPAPRVIAVVGPTAAGKSDLGVSLARRLGGEVVNADSMQLYRGMDIGTAKLTPEERQGVPHHLLDIWDVTETAS